MKIFTNPRFKIVYRIEVFRLFTMFSFVDLLLLHFLIVTAFAYTDDSSSRIINSCQKCVIMDIMILTKYG